MPEVQNLMAGFLAIHIMYALDLHIHVTVHIEVCDPTRNKQCSLFQHIR